MGQGELFRYSGTNSNSQTGNCDFGLYHKTSLPRSRLDCAVSCANSHGCVTFTYSGQGSLGPGSCRGHSTNMESGSPQDENDGAKTYSRSSSPTLGIFLVFFFRFSLLFFFLSFLD